MNEMKEIIGTFGFPLLACVVMYMDGRKDKKEFYDSVNTFNTTMAKFDVTLTSIDKRLDKLERGGSNNVNEPV